MASFTSGNIQGIQFKTLPCQKLSDAELMQCKNLFDNHYGKWGEGSERKGQQIRFPRSLYQTYRNSENTYVALAIDKGTIIGQAFYLKTSLENQKKIAWVLQLVVHEHYRMRGIAKTLLYSIWGFSDDYAWGLATSNALTVKTLEKATFRKVTPNEILKHKEDIIMIKESIPFAKDADVYIDETSSLLNSSFPVDRQVIEKNLRLYDGTWELGELPQGHEWLAFTFQTQEYQMTQEEYNEMFENSEKIVNDAYNRMELSKQPWNRHQKDEVDFILDYLKSNPIHNVIDFGCGNGRHTLEFACRNFHATGIDYSPRNIQVARQSAEKMGTTLDIQFVEGDCRNYNLTESADLALCLYDVVGSFIQEKDNLDIIHNIYNHLNPHGILVLSVMNLELTSHIALHKVSNVSQHLDALATLKPNRIMQKSGNIFDPNYFLLETDSGVVYRKEQFENDEELSAEYVIRDKRYSRNEICSLLTSANFRILETRYVQAGRWNTPLDAHNHSAKEILIFAQRQD